MRFNHCPHCGAAFPLVDTSTVATTSGGDAPKPLLHQACAACGIISHHNPLPVAVNMIPCLDEHLYDPARRRWLVGQRNILPKKGEFAMLAGFLEIGESVEIGGAREVGEEARVLLPADSRVQLMGSLHVPRGNHLLIFCAWPAMPETIIDRFEPNEETQSLAWHHRDEPIAFPLHAEAIRRWGDLAVTLLNSPQQE